MKSKNFAKNGYIKFMRKGTLYVIPPECFRERYFLKSRKDSGQAGMTEIGRERKSSFILHPSSFIPPHLLLAKGGLRGGGFTLLEVLISLAIVGSLLVTLIYTLNYHLSIAERQEVVTVATLLAKNKIADLEKKPEDNKGVFDPPYDDYAYETSVKESPYIGVSEIAVVVKRGSEEVKLNEFIFR
jgi:general secretion pathway protein I